MSTAGDANQMGTGSEGWSAYHQFVRSVQQSLRYVRCPAAEQFLADVLASSKQRKLTIPKGTLYWRARLGCEIVQIGTEDEDSEGGYEMEQPYGGNGMKPIPNWMAEGRANPRGIPYLYLATSRDTALAEVRPWIDSKVSIAQFRIRRDLTIIDCSVNHSDANLPRVLFDSSMSREEGIWAAIDRAFATPVTRSEEGGEYIPTQIISEMFNREGGNGIRYKSLLTKDGFNLVLFDLSDADMVRNSLYRVTSLAFGAESINADYCVRGDAEMKASAPAPLDDELDGGSQ